MLDQTPKVVGNCVVCGRKIEVAKWVAEIMTPNTCSRPCGEAFHTGTARQSSFKKPSATPPSQDKLKESYERNCQNISKIAVEFKMTWYMANVSLKKAGII